MYSKVKDFLTDDDFINYVLGWFHSQPPNGRLISRNIRMNWQTRKKPRQY